MTQIRQKNHNYQLRIKKTSPNLQFDQGRTHSRNKSGQTTVNNSKHALIMPNIIFQTPNGQYTIHGIKVKDNNGELEQDEHEDLESNRLTCAKQTWYLDRNDLMRNFPLSYFENLDLLYKMVGRKKRFQTRSCKNLKKVNKEQRQKEIRISGDQNLDQVFKEVQDKVNYINENHKSMDKMFKQFQVQSQRIDQYVDHKDKPKIFSEKKPYHRIHCQSQKKSIQHWLKAQESNRHSDSRDTLLSHKNYNHKFKIQLIEQNKQNLPQKIRMLRSQRDSRKRNDQITDQNINGQNVNSYRTRDRRNRLDNRNKKQIVNKQQSGFEKLQSQKIFKRNNIQSLDVPIVLNNKKAGQIQKVSAVPLSKRSLKFATLHANNKVRKSFTKMKENNIALNDVQVERHVSFQKEQDDLQDKKTVKFGHESKVQIQEYQNEDKYQVIDENIMKKKGNNCRSKQTKEIAIEQEQRRVIHSKIHESHISPYQRKLSNQPKRQKNKCQKSILKQTHNSSYTPKQNQEDGQASVHNNKPIKSFVNQKAETNKKDSCISSNKQQEIYNLTAQNQQIKVADTQLSKIDPTVLENDRNQQQIQQMSILADYLDYEDKENKIECHQLKIESNMKDQSHDELKLINQQLKPHNIQQKTQVECLNIAHHNTKQCAQVKEQNYLQIEDRKPSKDQQSNLMPVIDCYLSNETDLQKKQVQIKQSDQRQPDLNEVFEGISLETKSKQRIKSKMINDQNKQQNLHFQPHPSNQVQIQLKSFSLTSYNSQLNRQDDGLKESLIKIEDWHSENEDYISNDTFNVSPSTCEFFNKNRYRVKESLHSQLEKAQAHIKQEKQAEDASSMEQNEEEQIKRTPYFHKVPEQMQKKIQFEATQNEIKITLNQDRNNPQVSNFKLQRKSISKNKIQKKEQSLKQGQELNLPISKVNKHRLQRSDQLSIGSEEINHFYNQFIQFDNFYPYQDSFAQSQYKQQREYLNKPCQSNLIIKDHQDIQPNNKKDTISNINHTKKQSLKSIQKIVIPFTDSADCINSTTFKNIPPMHKNISLGSRASIFSRQSDTHRGTNAIHNYQRRQEQVTIPQQFDEEMLYQSELVNKDRKFKKQKDQQKVKLAVQDNQQYEQHEKLEQSMNMIDLQPNPYVKNQTAEQKKQQSKIVIYEKQSEQVLKKDGQWNSVDLGLKTPQHSSFFHLDSEEQAEIDRDVNNFHIQGRQISSESRKILNQHTITKRKVQQQGNMIKIKQEQLANQSKPKIIVRSRGSCIKTTKGGDNRSKQQNIRASKSMKQLKQKKMNQFQQQLNSPQLDEQVMKTKQIVKPVNRQIQNPYLQQMQQVNRDALNKFQSEMILEQEKKTISKNQQRSEQKSRQTQEQQDQEKSRTKHKENNRLTFRKKKNDKIGFHKTYDINIMMNLRTSNESSSISLQKQYQNLLEVQKQKSQQKKFEVPLKKQINLTNCQAQDIGFQVQQIVQVQKVEQVIKITKTQDFASRIDLQVIQSDEVQLLISNMLDKQVQKINAALTQQDRVDQRKSKSIIITQNNLQIKIGKDKSGNVIKDEQYKRKQNFQLVQEYEKKIILDYKTQHKEQIIQKQIQDNYYASQVANQIESHPIQTHLSNPQSNNLSLKKVKQIYCALQEKYIELEDLLQKKQLFPSITPQQPTRAAQYNFQKAISHTQQHQEHECLELQSKIKQQMQDLKQSYSSQRKAKEDTMQTIRQSHQPSKTDAYTNTLDPLTHLEEHFTQNNYAQLQNNLASVSEYCKNFDLQINHLPENKYKLNEKCWWMIKSIIFFIDIKGQFYSRLIDKHSVWLYTDQQNNTFQRYSKSSENINSESLVKQTLRKYLGNKYKHDSQGEELNQEQILKLYFQLLFGMPVLLVKPSCFNKLDNLYRHHNIFGFTYGKETVWRIVGTVDNKRQKEQKYIRLQSTNTKEIIQISWALFLSEFNCSFISGFFYNYFYRGISFQSVKNQKTSGQTFTARLKVPLQHESSQKQHFLMGAKFPTTTVEQLSGKIMVYMKVKSEKEKEEHFKYLGSGDIFLLSMKLRAGEYLIVLQIATKLRRCLTGKLLMASEIKNGELMAQPK